MCLHSLSYICLVYLLNVRYLSVVSAVRRCKKWPRTELLFWDQNCQNKKPLQFNFLLSIFFQNFLCLRNNTVSPDCLIQQKTLSLWAGLMLFFPPIVSIRGIFPGGVNLAVGWHPVAPAGASHLLLGERGCAGGSMKSQRGEKKILPRKSQIGRKKVGEVCSDIKGRCDVIVW